MAINIGRLWRDSSFYKLDIRSKLLYVYLSTSPNINSLGLLNLNIKVSEIETGLSDNDFRSACKELISKGYIIVYGSKKGAYFFVKGHFGTLPRSVSVSKRANKDILSIPNTVLDKMVVDGVLPDIEQHSDFTAPDSKEVEEYSISQGYLVNGKDFVDFYEGNAKRLGKSKGWYDGRGKEVRDWKAKLRKVWFRNADKIPEHRDAPKGFEHYVTWDDNGNIIFPKGWRKGLPYGDNMYEDKLLIKGFNESTKDS